MLREGSGFEARGVDWGLAEEAAVEEACVLMLAEEGLLAMADVVRIGTGRLSDVLFELAIPESVTVLLLDASVGVLPPSGFLNPLSFSLFPCAVDDAAEVALLLTSGLFIPCECD